MATEEKQAGGVGNAGAWHGGRLAAAGARGARRLAPLHALGRAPVQPLRRLQGGGHRGRRCPPRAGRRLRRRGLGEGDADAGRLRPDRRPGRHQRDERDRGRQLQRLAARRPRRPRSRDDLGHRPTAGDRSPADRLLDHQERRDRQGRGRDRRGDRPRRRHRRRRADRPDLPRLPPRRRLHGGESYEAPPRRRGPRRAAGCRCRGGRRDACRGRASGDDGRHRPLLGPGRASSCSSSPRGSACRSS